MTTSDEKNARKSAHQATGAKVAKNNPFCAMNAKRADSALVAIAAFSTVFDVDYEDALGDLITNLLHLARRDQGRDFDAGAFLRGPIARFEEELEEARRNRPY
jgi:hypothetical protein